jgi:hypothetical protein
MRKSTPETTPAVTPPWDDDADSAAEGNGAAGQPTSPNDVFTNLENIRLKQDFNRAQIKKPFTACPLRKPKRHEWFQSHPDPAFRFQTELFALKEGMNAEWYMPIGQDVIAELDPGALFACVLYPWINRKNQVSLLPVQLYDADGRDNDWWSSMRDVMDVHAVQGKWIGIAGGNQAYDVEVAENAALPAPKWPEVDLNTILRTAFKGGRLIDRLDHPVIAQAMRGSV